MKILYIMSSYNLYGGTPKKTLDLMKFFKENSLLYVYSDALTVYKTEFQRNGQVSLISEYEKNFSGFKSQFKSTGGQLYEGFYGNNFFQHLRELLRIIDKEGVTIIQTQFTFGETLGFLIKLLRPKIKLVIAFVGPFKPKGIKGILSSSYYSLADSFVYITDYVKNEKQQQFPILKNKPGRIIYNGTEKRLDDGTKIFPLEGFSLLSVAALVEWKNLQIVIKALEILIKENKLENMHLYLAGDGNYKKELENLVIKLDIQKNVHFLGNQTNIGGLLERCSLFVHPSKAEGFGIAVAEAMLSEKPIIVSNAGALPELIKHNKSGFVVDPYNYRDWSDTIYKIYSKPILQKKISDEARLRAETNFSIENYVRNYELFYHSL